MSDIRARTATSKKCYNDIPIEGGGFVQPNSRLLVKTSSPRPCDDHYSTVVKTVDGKYVEVNQQLRARSPPLQAYGRSVTSLFRQNNLEHIHVNKHVVYSEEEIQSWENLLSFPSYSQAMNAEIMLGSCYHSGACQEVHTQPANFDQYDFSKLQATIMEKLNLWEQLRQFIRQEGDLMALAVLVIYGLKLILHIVFIGLTILRHGCRATLSLLIRFYLDSYYIYTRVLSQVEKRQQRQQQQQQEQQEIPLLVTASTADAPPTYRPPQPQQPLLTKSNEDFLKSPPLRL